jgi:hypothetical protein
MPKVVGAYIGLCNAFSKVMTGLHTSSGKMVDNRSEIILSRCPTPQISTHIVFLNVMPCSLVDRYQFIAVYQQLISCQQTEDGGNKFLRNVTTHEVVKYISNK